MISKSLVEMTKCRWREFKREPSAFAFVLIFPVFFMIVLGMAFNSERPVPKLVGLTTQFSAGESTYQALKNNADIRLEIASKELLSKSMIKGKVSLIISKDSSGRTEFTFDRNSPEGELTSLYVNQLIQKSAGQEPLVKTTTTLIQTPGSRYVDFLIPGLLAFSIMSTSMFGTGMVLVVNRRENLLKRYLTTPMRPFEYILSHVIGRQFIMLIEFAIIMTCGYLIFGFQPQGSFTTYLAVAVLGTFVFTVLSMLIGAKTNNAGAYNGISNLIMLPMAFLCGVWYSKYLFPSWLVSVSELLPLSPLIDGLRAVALEGAGIMDILPKIGLLVGYGVVFSILSKKAFRWY